jgi:hypothetical protein
MEPNDSLATAAAISTGTNFLAQISSVADVDYYKFTTTSANDIAIRLDNLPADYDLKLLSADGTEMNYSENYDTAAEVLYYKGASAGTYYIEVLGYDTAFSNTNCYRLSTSITPAGCSDNYEPNNSNGNEPSIPRNTLITGQISYPGDVDWYETYGDYEEGYSITLTHPAGEGWRLRVFNGFNQEINEGQAINETTIHAGFHYIEDSPYSVKITGPFSTDSNQCYSLVAGTVGEARKSNTVITNSAIRVYPVPAKDKIYTEFNSKSNKQQYITITDISGKVVYKQQHGLIAGKNKLEILLPSSLTNGVYILSSGNHSQKFVLQR